MSKRNEIAHARCPKCGSDSPSKPCIYPEDCELNQLYCNRKNCQFEGWWRPVIVLAPPRNQDNGARIRMVMGIVICEQHRKVEERAGGTILDVKDLIASMKKSGLAIDESRTKLEFIDVTSKEALTFIRNKRKLK